MSRSGPRPHLRAKNIESWMNPKNRVAAANAGETESPQRMRLIHALTR